MTLYIPLEVPLWILAFVAGYLVLSVAIAVRVYVDRQTVRPWKLSNWRAAIITGPLVLLELLLEGWVKARQAKRRMQQ